MTATMVITDIKKQFYAFRNGIIAETLRKQGSPYKYIFGLNLPQINEIAQNTEHTVELALQLLDNESTRESQLLSAMLIPANRLTVNLAQEWIEKAKSREAIDVFCMKQLSQNREIAVELIASNIGATNPLTRYAVLRMFFRLLPEKLEDAKKFAEHEFAQNCDTTRLIALQLLNEISYFVQENSQL
ncbi:MAG: DNA alkylation repair protein [Muribaculum sp.]|nr:DNA alkylation repair protein [Muribaculaceae bacterium]MCM1080934.1 DNA alkylation repair protein [Muribaculum sp.]